MKVLILGVTGMLGNVMFRYLSRNTEYEVYGSARSAPVSPSFDRDALRRIVTGIDVENPDALIRLFSMVKPDVVINCVGLIKQLAAAEDPLAVIPINAILPHRLAALCGVIGARLIHISTDCVFSGDKGHYLESDPCDAEDLYGKSKYLGELSEAHTVTLRTSIIGPELNGGRHALLGWFLAQEGTTGGYVRAIFSGLPTVELARVIDSIVIPKADLSGLYHVAAQPISKFDLLNLIAEIYGKQIEIREVEDPVIDRSLDASRFNTATGYHPPTWRDLVASMFNFR